MKAGTSGLRSGSRLDRLAEALPERAATLSRLFLARTDPPLSRTEVGVLRALTAGPIRITELARREGVTQPAISLLVNRLEARGWVTREEDPGDRRAVLVAITGAGSQAFDRVRAQFRALLHEEMASLPAGEVETLASAVAILDKLIRQVQEEQA
jgi:DNA-binding MarR family transcriptional regulator